MRKQRQRAWWQASLTRDGKIVTEQAEAAAAMLALTGIEQTPQGMDSRVTTTETSDIGIWLVHMNKQNTAKLNLHGWCVVEAVGLWQGDMVEWKVEIEMP